MKRERAVEVKCEMGSSGRRITYLSFSAVSDSILIRRCACVSIRDSEPWEFSNLSCLFLFSHYIELSSWLGLIPDPSLTLFKRYPFVIVCGLERIDSGKAISYFSIYIAVFLLSSFLFDRKLVSCCLSRLIIS